MKIIFVTHPEAERVDPQGSFRPLSEKGIVDLKFLGKEIHTFLVENKVNTLSILSSSAVRCVQTAFELGNKIRMLENTRILQQKNKSKSDLPDSSEPIFISDRFIVTDNLNELLVVSKETQKMNTVPINQERLASSLDSIPENDVILMVVHGDFANLISKDIVDEAVDGFFFQARPVFGIIELTKSREGNWKIQLVDCFRIQISKFSLKKEGNV